MPISSSVTGTSSFPAKASFIFGFVLIAAACPFSSLGTANLSGELIYFSNSVRGLEVSAFAASVASGGVVVSGADSATGSFLPAD